MFRLLQVPAVGCWNANVVVVVELVVDAVVPGGPAGVSGAHATATDATAMNPTAAMARTEASLFIVISPSDIACAKVPP